MTLAINGHASFSTKFLFLAPTWCESWKRPRGRQDTANLGEISERNSFPRRILSDYGEERKGDGNVVHKSIKMWRAEQKICYAAVSPCFPFGTKSFSIFQRVLFKKSICVVGRLHSKQIFPVCYRWGDSAASKAISSLNWLPQFDSGGKFGRKLATPAGTELARNQKIIKACVTLCEAAVKSCKFLLSLHDVPSGGMLDTFSQQCRL